MSFSDFFSKQARKPSGLFGRIVMSRVFDKGNASLNNFMKELMSVQTDDLIFEIGFGTGKLIYDLVQKLERGHIEGIDFSDTMISMARKRNKKQIAAGKVQIQQGNFEETTFDENRFDKVCTTNTIYFWQNPEKTLRKIHYILKPGGRCFISFEDKAQLESMQLNSDVFQLYSNDDVIKLLRDAGFNQQVEVKSKENDPSLFHCAIATK